MALGSTQPLQKSVTGIFPWGVGGKHAGYVSLTTWPPSSAKCMEIWEPKPPRSFSGLQ